MPDGGWLDHDDRIECSKQWPSLGDGCMRRSFADSSDSNITALEQKSWHTQHQDVCCNQIIVNNEKCLESSRTASSGIHANNSLEVI